MESEFNFELDFGFQMSPHEQNVDVKTIVAFYFMSKENPLMADREPPKKLRIMLKEMGEKEMNNNKKKKV